MYTLALTKVDRSVSYFMTTKRLRQGGIEPPAQLSSIHMAKLYFTTKPLARLMEGNVSYAPMEGMLDKG